jgi:hypothetical protein
MSLTVTVSGLGTTQLALNKGLQSAVAKLSQVTYQSLVQYTPRKSGNARRGWTADTKRDSFEVTNSVPYINRLENNYSKQTRGQGIIGPALNQVKRKFK